VIRFKLLPLAIVGSLALVGCSKPADTPASEVSPQAVTAAAAISAEEQRLNQFFADTYAEDMQRYPFTASYLGIKDNHDQWNSVSESFQDESKAITEARLETINGFDESQLSDARKLSLSLYRLGLERDLMVDEYRHHDYILHQFRGPHTSVASGLINIHQIKDLADAEAYIGRLNNVALYFDGVIEQLNIRTEQGFMLVEWMYPQILEAAGNVITGAPFDDSDEDSAIWGDFQTKVAALELEDAEKQRLLSAAKTALIEVVQPAYVRLIATLEVQSQGGDSDDGIWRYEDGDAFYQTLLKWYTTTELTADEVHELGLANVERIHGEMRAVMAQVGFEGTLQEFFASVRENPELRFANTDEGREEYLTAARDAIDAMRAQLPEFFGILPTSELTVKRVEAFREKSAGKAFYQGPPPDGSRPGIYYANLYDMDSMPKSDIEALAFHEGLPGHHLQRSISTELKDVPEFQRHSSFTAFTEGWGLYSEYLAKEMGFYQDPYSEFGRLSMELWRAARLVVDTGLHAKRWTREEAIAYLVENTPNAAWDCTKAIERYIAMPGQATAYMIGKIRILELREMAREALGDQFDIREFHDNVLKNGPVPLAILEENIKAMIAAKQSAS
jgi:uncharacterized protein (DUF885 family)